MYHDDAWRFMRIGCFIERAQLTISLILAHVAATRRTGESLNDDWSSLLRVCQALDVYRRRYGVAIRPDRVLDLLVTDERLPRSLTRGMDAVAEELATIEAGPGPAAEALRLARSLAETIRGDWPVRPDLDSPRARPGRLAAGLPQVAPTARRGVRRLPREGLAARGESPAVRATPTGRSQSALRAS